MPRSGHSPTLIAVIAIGYAVVAAGYWLTGRQPAGPGVGGSMPTDFAQRSSS
jgi:hypothetical protein